MDKPGPKTLSSILYCSVVVMAGCYYDKKELLYPQAPDCNPSNVSYSADIKPILTQQCYGCHNTQLASGNVILDTHAGVQKEAASGRLSGAINHQPGFSPMPQGASKLPACDIQKITKWIEEGISNN